MSRHRQPREDEIALWQEVTRDVERPKRRKLRLPVKDKRAAPKKADLVGVPKESARPAPASKAPVGPTPVVVRLDGATAERLRKGKVEPEATLDLHGLTQAQSHLRLSTFIKRSVERQLRCVLIVTGKGAPSHARPGDDAAFELHARSKSGVLREMVPRWLAEGSLRSCIAGSHGAHARHGGGGALYVYLKKSRLPGKV